MNSLTYMEKCKCGKKVLICIVNNGSNHIMGAPSVTCDECLKTFKPNEKWAEENPEEAKPLKNL